MAQTPTQVLSKRQICERERAQLEQERSSFISHWADLGRFLMPRGPRFDRFDVNRGNKRNEAIIDSTATLALRTLRSGMMSGVTSPARPWFRLLTPDPALNETAAVKKWLYDASERMATVFLRSNLYNVLPTVYGYMGGFGTAAMSVEEDFDDVVRFYPFPIGSYAVANNEKLQVNTFVRTFRMTVRQLVDKFGRDPADRSKINWTLFSSRIKNHWEMKQFETWIDVTHVIKPNEDFNPRKLGSKYKRFISYYYESGTAGVTGQADTGADSDTLLREKGYDYFPILCPRWELTGEDVYGTSCPGMDALGDIKQLQMGEKRSAEAIEKIVRPPMVADSEMKQSKTTILPGEVTYLSKSTGVGFKPAYQVEIRITELEQKQQQIRQRIKTCFFEDLFLMMAESDRRQITATEIDERKEEKLLALGPVLEQLNQDLLDPLIRITFTIMNRQRLIDPPPPELRQAPLQVEYMSVMAQAQKLLGVESIEKFTGFVGQISQANPDAQDKVDVDQLIDTYGDMLSVPPGIIRSDDQVAQIRAQKQQAQAAQQQQQQMAQSAQTAQTLSQTDTGGGKNALQQLMQMGQAGNLIPQQ